GTDSDEASGNLSQNWKPFQQTNHKGQGALPVRHLTRDDVTMNEDLHSLNKAGWPFATRLHLAQIVHGNRTGSQFFAEQIGSRDGILNGEIDAHAACRGHRMSRIAYAKQSFAVPIAQTIDLNRQQFDL